MSVTWCWWKPCPLQYLRPEQTLHSQHLNLQNLFSRADQLSSQDKQRSPKGCRVLLTLHSWLHRESRLAAAHYTLECSPRKTCTLHLGRFISACSERPTGCMQGREVDDSDQFHFNTDFSERLYRIKINAIQMKETVEENKKTNDQVLQDRQYQVRACAPCSSTCARKLLYHCVAAGIILRGTDSARDGCCQSASRGMAS